MSSYSSLSPNLCDPIGPNLATFEITISDLNCLGHETESWFPADGPDEYMLHLHQVPLFDSYVVTNAVQRRDFGGRDLTVCSSGSSCFGIDSDSFVVMFVRQGGGRGE